VGERQAEIQTGRWSSRRSRLERYRSAIVNLLLYDMEFKSLVCACHTPGLSGDTLLSRVICFQTPCLVSCFIASPVLCLLLLWPVSSPPAVLVSAGDIGPRTRGLCPSHCLTRIAATAGESRLRTRNAPLFTRLRDVPSAHRASEEKGAGCVRKPNDALVLPTTSA
jgi:hypothetical protein